MKLSAKKILFLFYIGLTLLPLVSAASINPSETANTPQLVIIGLLTVFLLVLGFAIDSPLLAVAGTVLLFVAGLVILNGGVLLKTGSYLNETVVDNSTITTESYVYEKWDTVNTHFVGWLIVVISVVLFSLVLYNTKNGGDGY